jgi:multidrug efflux pump subunit AcrA (membrane-fusion protein)
MSSGKPIVFISYAHRDEPANGEFRWLEFALEYLRPGEVAGVYQLWVDQLMMGGANWEAEIEAKLRVCDIFILLVSARSMASEFILGKELPIVRERDARGEPIHIYPVLLTPTPIIGLDNVRDKNIRPGDGEALSGLSDHLKRKAMARIADEIAGIARRVAAPRDVLAPAIDGAPGAVSGAARLSKVDIGHLPETAYKRLVGRNDELLTLDAAWKNPEINIFSLVAEGGAGKSALLNEWLTRLRSDNYRGADAVLGWSFYSQGSKERATSSEQFLDWALERLGARAKANSAMAKGEAIAEAMTRRRVLLALDGIEPLQYGPGPEAGKLQDPGLRELLRRFAAEPPFDSRGLIVLTSRAEVADIAKWKEGAAPVERVENLSDEAGAALLADGGVKGSQQDSEIASHDFGGHPLALQLLASLLRDTQNGDVLQRDHIRGLLADADNPGHDHARRVMESYEREWLVGQPLLHTILFIVGLFDRPASADCVKELRAKPAIKGLTGQIVGLSDTAWRRAVQRLREARLLSPAEPTNPDALDAHPLVREWFGEQLLRTNEPAWKAAHSRLYDHLRRTTHEGDAPTLADLAPLYHAIGHGCRAGRHQEALNQVYRNRLCRREPNGGLMFYSSKMLGAHGSNLAAISWFFDRPYEWPAGALIAADRAWVLGEASFALRAQGRLREALSVTRLGISMEEDDADWPNASISAAKLSETELLLGEVATARATAQRSLVLADRSGNEAQMILRRATLADALTVAGERGEAESLFADAEARQRQSSHPLLFSLQGYQYCDWLLTGSAFAAARDRAKQTLELGRSKKIVLDIGLDALTLGRAHHGLARPSALERLGENARADAHAAAALLDEAIENLRASGQNTFLPGGLLARAAFRRVIADWPGATRDLEEVEEIAEPGPMRLFLCDLALERARLALARREAFAPLNGVVAASPGPPMLPDPAETATLLDEARAQVATASKLVIECGYHKRNEELLELEAVLARSRRFADLPPHV